MKGRSRDPRAQEIIRKALLCRLFKCTPDKLEEISYEDLITFDMVYGEMLKKNPLSMFM